MRIRPRLRSLLRRWNPYNDFTWLRTLQVFTRDFLDKAGIRLQRANLVTKLEVFLVKAIQISLHSLDLILCSPHRNKTVRSKNVVNHQRQNKKSKHGPAMAFQKSAEPGFAFRLFQRIFNPSTPIA